MTREQLLAALRNAEDLVAFFARAAVLRHCSSIARDAGQADEALRLLRLAQDSERKVANVVQRMLGRGLAAPRGDGEPPPH